MASVMSIVSQVAFAQLEKVHGTITPGRVVPVDRHIGTHAALGALAGGGTLHLVTVRPGPAGEELWLVGVLHNPTLEEAGWVAEPNALAVRDITSVVGELRLASGNGIQAEPGRMAMSLRTPWVLADADDVLLRAIEAPSPGSAYHVAMVATIGGTGTRGRAPIRPAPVAPVVLREEPLPWAEALADIATWRTLGERARHAAITEVALAVSTPDAPYAVATVRCGRDRLGVVTHTTSGSELVVVPGGHYAMGFTVDDLLAIWRACPVGGEDDADAGEVGYGVKAARPPISQGIRPFLLGRALVRSESLVAAADLPEGGDVREAMAQLGWRLPTEAEWEWIAREGGAVRFVGVPPGKHPLRPSLVPPAESENGWGFRGLLDDPNAVASGEVPMARMGHTYWQSETEVVGLHAACRIREPGAIRLARAIPGAPAPGGGDVTWSDHGADTLAALRGKGKDRERALRALATARPAGPDTAALMTTLLPELPTLDAAILPRVVERLGEVGVAGISAALGLLSHPRPAVRASAAAACGGAADPSPLSALSERLADERNTEVRASLALAIGGLAERAGLAEVPPALLALTRARVDPLVRGAAAIGAARAVGAARLDAAAGEALVLAATLGQRPGVRWLPGRAVPEADGDLARWAIALLAGAGPEVRRAAAMALVTDGNTVGAALELAFGARTRDADGDPVHRPLLDPADLDPAQRALLVHLSAPDTRSQMRDLVDYGVPVTVEDRRIWLGLDPPGAWEVPVPGGDEPLWRRLDGLHHQCWLPDGEWEIDGWLAATRPILAGLTPVQRLALWLEATRFGRDLQGASGHGLDLPKDPTKLVRAAMKASRDTTRAVISTRLRSRWADARVRARALHAYVATLAPGEALPRELWPFVEVTRDYPKAIVAAVPVGDREELLLPRLEAALATARAASGWPRGVEFLIEAHAPLLPLVPSERIARILLQFVAASGDARMRQPVARHKAHPWVAAALAVYAAFGKVADLEAAQRVLREM